MIFSSFAGPNVGAATDYSLSATYIEGDTFDECGGHSSTSSSASYHIHVPPSCLLTQLGQTDSAHSPQIGWALDGFPVSSGAASNPTPASPPPHPTLPRLHSAYSPSAH